MIAKEILDQRIVAAKPEELIKEAAIRFLGHNLGHIPVVESEHLVGLLSIETMLEDGLLEKECAYALSPTIIPQTHPNAPLSKVFGPMMGQHLTVLPVVNADEKYVGCITTASWLSFLQESPLKPEIHASDATLLQENYYQKVKYKIMKLIKHLFRNIIYQILQKTIF